MHKTLFLHGLDSSSKGTKGQWFAKHFPEVQTPDFKGDLSQRLDALETMCHELNKLTLVGSSFGGLMATCFAIRHPSRCHSLVLLAPALNFLDFSPPQERITTPTNLFIGKQDTVTPPEKVLPLAKKTFSNLQIVTFDDDHMLHNSFKQLDWEHLLLL